MKPPNRQPRPLVLLLSIALFVSVGLNWFLLKKAMRYLAAFNEIRLDPLGFNIFPAASNQPGGTNPGQTRVVFFGDSRAADWPFPAELPEFEFINRGIHGHTSTQTRLRFDNHIQSLQPQVIILQVGVNDLSLIPQFPEQKEAITANCRENIRQIVNQSLDSGATVIVTTIFPVSRASAVPLYRQPLWSSDISLAINDVNAFIRSLAAERVVIFDAYALLADEDGAIQAQYAADELHLNMAGYEKLNQELAPVLRSFE